MLIHNVHCMHYIALKMAVNVIKIDKMHEQQTDCHGNGKTYIKHIYLNCNKMENVHYSYSK